MCHNNPPVRNAVIAALKAHGPMTCHEIADAMDWPLVRVQSTLRNARRIRPGEVFRAVGYKRFAEGRGKDVSIYAAEEGPDVPRAVTGKYQRRKASQARYRDRHRAIINARIRSARARDMGRSVPRNIWAQLAHKNSRSAMSIAVMRSSD